MNIQQVMIPDHDVATARVPGPARVGSGPGRPGQGQLNLIFNESATFWDAEESSSVVFIPAAAARKQYY
jgi:hypothetical protein